MSSQNTVWVVINCQTIVDNLRERIDNGAFSEVNEAISFMKAFSAKLQSMVQQYGGHVYVMLYERVVIEMPITIADQVPGLVDELKKEVGPEVACGIGMDYEEAHKACLASQGSGNIELYGEDETTKSDEWEGAKDPFEISPNLFNPEMQRTVNPIPGRPPNKAHAPVMRPGIEEELQMDAQYLQALGQSLGAGQQPQPQPGQEGQQPGQPGQEQEEPQDLLEALNGGPVDGHSPKKDEEESEEEGEPEEKDEMDSEEGDGDDHSKLAASLLGIRDRIPELITLQERNPEAFKQSLAMIQKLIGLARSRKKATAKSEIDDINVKIDELAKKIQMKYPVGTRKGRKVKVIIDGKAVWRSMSSGRVQDAKGQAISVKSHNATAQSGSQEEQK